MRITGRKLRDGSAAVFNTGVLVALPCHAVETLWFWVPMATVLWGAFLLVVGLETLHMLGPEWVDRWWDH